MYSYIPIIVTLFAMFWAISSPQKAKLDLYCGDPTGTQALSPRNANYRFEITLDHERHLVRGTELVSWVNLSPDTIQKVRMYMYMNAFKNNQSSFIKGAGGQVFGQALDNRPAEEWGWIEASNITQNGVPLNSRYVQPDDGNPQDETVLEINLEHEILPGDSLALQMDIESKLPKTIARSGYSRNDFHLFVHWYPKMGVYEQDLNGKWGWNCHQFLRQMEFYGDFGTYDVSISASDHLVLGASGCLLKQTSAENGMTTYHYRAEDVIDFAWTAYPDFIKYRDQWNHVEIELLSPPHHKSLVPRFLNAVKNSLEYLDQHVGSYPYAKITIMDPPAHAMRNGFMEYPTFITGGSFYAFPKGIKTLESLIVHEFTHQYFMGMLANNEKEEAWLDEGFVTFYEDEIMEHYYEPGASLIDIMGYRVGNYDLTRNEYTSMENKRVSPITKPSYQIRERFKGIVYAKTALMLRTLQAHLGDAVFDEMIKTYFDKYKFSHPRKNDFVHTVLEITANHFDAQFTQTISAFLEQALDGTQVCDYQVTQINVSPKPGLTGWMDGRYIKESRDSQFISSARIHRLGDFVMPVEIAFTFDDGLVVNEYWNARDNSKLYEYTGPRRLVSVHIDPERKMLLDIDFNNNSFIINPKKHGITKYGVRAIFWLQNVLQATSFLM